MIYVSHKPFKKMNNNYIVYKILNLGEDLEIKVLKAVIEFQQFKIKVFKLQKVVE